MLKNIKCSLVQTLKISRTKFLATGPSQAFNHCLSSRYYSLSNGKGLRQINGTQFGFLLQSKSSYMSYDEAVEKNKQMQEANKDLLIYYGTYEAQLKGVKVFSLSTSVITILAQFYLYDSLSGLSTPIAAAIYACAGFFSFVTPWLIHLLAGKYVVEIKYNSKNDTYVIKTLTFLLRKRLIHCKLEDIKKVDFESAFSSIKVRDQPLIIFEKDFLHKEHYGKIMGYDKPIDWSVYQTGSSKT